MLQNLRTLYVGRPIGACIDAIERTVRKHGYDSVNIMDPVFNSSVIMTDPKRVNIHVDSESKVRSFSIG